MGMPHHAGSLEARKSLHVPEAGVRPAVACGGREETEMDPDVLDFVRDEQFI